MKTLHSSAVTRLEYGRKISKLPALFVAAIVSYSAGVSADDTDIFFSTESAPPNILFVLDNSGSMDNTDGPALNPGPTRIEKVKSALGLLVNSLEDVNVGIIEFETTPELTVPVGKIEAIKGKLEVAINAMEADGLTGTQAALWHARDYLRGQLQGPDGFYSSPIVHECQENHIIVMTDGRPSKQLNIIAEVEGVIDGGSCDEVSSLDADGAPRTNVDGTPIYDDSRKCGKEIAEHLLSEDLSGVDSINNAHTHTIGFSFSDPWLESVAAAGSGTYFEVSSSEGLVDAIKTIIKGIGSSFAAPTISVNSFNQSRHSDELYFAQFQSSSSVRWNGNIKKYKISEVTDEDTGETRGVIVDANYAPLLDATTGEIASSSRSLWSEKADGGSIPEGGFAHELPAYDERHWYTDYDSEDPVKVTYDEVNPDLVPPASIDTKLPLESLGAADADERSKLMSWALGRSTVAVDPLEVAAAIDAQVAATQAAADAAVFAAEARADSAAKIELEEAAISARDTAAAAAGNALIAYQEASAANAADAATLYEVWDTLEQQSIEAEVAATVAITEAEAAREALSDAEANKSTADAAAELQIAAAQEASDENHYYVADSLHNSPIVASYWADSDSDRSGEILFSANNMGVLHAIDPKDGTELWSYTPEEHLGNIKEYFDNQKRPQHVYGLDGEFTLHTTRTDQVGYDYYVDDAWLYMTERRGGNRVYALDVSDGLTDPADADPFSVMWKIAGGDGGTAGFADLAQTWSKPQMIDVKFNCGADTCSTKQLLMFSGGYNAAVYDDETLDYSSMTVPEDGHGNAVYFVDPESGDLEWSVGNGAGHSLNLSEMNHSIPSTPVPVDTNLDGFVDLIYFVDIGGDVWRVDFGTEGATTDELHVAGGKIAELAPVGQSLRFFNPVDVVISGTNISTAYFSLVTGSGMRSSPLYVEPNRNRLYTIKDRWVSGVPYRLDDDGNKEYDYRYVTDAGGDHSVITAGDDVLRNVSDTASTTADTYGYFRTFQPSEKVLQPTQVTDNRILANTYVPPELTGGANCSFDIGVTRLYISNLLDGSDVLPDSLRTSGNDFSLVGDGILGPVKILDTGGSSAPFVLAGDAVLLLKEITTNEAFRKFRRTGWVELDEY